MFCISCGRPLGETARFCPHCGAEQPPREAAAPRPAPPAEPAAKPAGPVPLRGTATAVAPPPAVRPAPPPKTGRKRRVPLAAKVLLSLVLLLAGTLFGLRAVLGYLNGPDRTIHRFVEAVQAQDADALRSVVSLRGGALELNGDTLAPFFAAYGVDEGALEALREQLLEDLAVLKQGFVPLGRGGVRLVRSGGPLFDGYKVELTCRSVALSSEFDGTNLILEGASYRVGREPQYVPLLPGVYSASSSYVDPATGITLENEAAPRRIGTERAAVHCAFDYRGAWLQTNVPDLKLTALAIDGQPYAGDLSRLNPQAGFSLAPVQADSEITVSFTAAGLPFQRTFRMAEGTYCLLEAGLRTVTLSAAQPELEVLEVLVGETSCTGALRPLALSRGFQLGPVPPESTILVRFSLAGMEFERSFPASDGRCLLAPDLPEDLRAQGEALACNLALLLIQLECSRDLDLLLQLEAAWGQSSPEFVSQWAERIRAEAAEMEEDGTYALFEDLAVRSVTSEAPVSASERITLSCTVETSSTALTQYLWSTGEAIRGTGGVSFPPVTVTLAYEDGQWRALSAGWET